MANKRERISKSNPVGVSLEDLTNAMLKPNPSPQAEKGGQITVGGYVITPLGVAGAGTFEDWNEALALTFQLESNLQIIIGDLLVIGEFEWGKTYDEIAAMTGRSVKTLYNYRYVMGNIDFSLRRENLSYSHYQLIAGIPEATREAWIDHASEHNLTKRELRNDMIEAKLLDSPTPPRSEYWTPATNRANNRIKRYLLQGKGAIRREDVEWWNRVGELLRQKLEAGEFDE